ncbi:hypothetical protein [Sphingobacterium bovistauri]|uniref:YXWGXW repeat-containing protein n=1 Tax=Sphingobacterium bovistauri TaxID=2781959 RepID=A0ABS7Z7H4_9SPHI|nr:hypothetical protein [Sphingobacterium bovistauri]MCA5005502.1 hypothetical protein [Sphingobacterium bovistauri]
MKKLLYITLLIGGLFIAKSSSAQVSVNINIGAQPLWGPVGYDYVRFYYIPAIDAYYNVGSRRYTYFQGNRWVTKSKLPGRYRNFDLYRTHKVVINDHNPWNHHRRHRSEYGRYSSYHNQPVLRDVRHHRYEVNRRSSKDMKHHGKSHKESRKNRNHRHDNRR